MKELTASSEIVLKKKLRSRISQGLSGVTPPEFEEAAAATTRNDGTTLVCL